jgi:hypothetical protein
MDAAIGDNSRGPLYRVLGKIAALWALANAGYFIFFPALGISLSYDVAPVAIACYFFLWAIISAVSFWDLFRAWPTINSRLWLYGLFSLGGAALLALLLYAFSFFPVLHGPILAPYTDILFATPWYFLPKAVDILVQQILIAALVLELSIRFHTLRKIILSYAIAFGGAHVFYFLFIGAPTIYAATLTAGAIASSFIFPYLILRVRGGVVYTYMIQLCFYILLAMLLHAVPPPGYGI